MRSSKKGVETEEKGVWRQRPEEHLSVKDNKMMAKRPMGQRVTDLLLMPRNDPLNSTPWRNQLFPWDCTDRLIPIFHNARSLLEQIIFRFVTHVFLGFQTGVFKQ